MDVNTFVSSRPCLKVSSSVVQLGTCPWTLNTVSPLPQLFLGNEISQSISPIYNKTDGKKKTQQIKSRIVWLIREILVSSQMSSCILAFFT